MMGVGHKPRWSDVADWWPNADHSRFPTTPGLRWHVQVFEPAAGAPKRDILLLHGTGASAHSWRDSAPALAALGRVVVPDLPGHGFTDTPRDKRLGAHAMTRMLGELMAAEGWQPDVIVGHSAGAALAVMLAARLETPPGHIVSTAGALFPFRGMAAPLFRGVARLLSGGIVVARLVSSRAGDSGAVERMVRQTGSDIDAVGVRCYQALFSKTGHVRAVLHMMSDWRVESVVGQLAQLDSRFLGFEPEQDHAIPKGEAAKAVAASASGRLINWPGAGHLAHEEQPDWFVEQLSTWIDGA